MIIYYLIHMDTNRLRQFCVIAETGSLTKAAELLFITHSGLSKSMKVLQEELRCELLRPSGRGLALTEEGTRIYKQAKQFLLYEEELFRKEPQEMQLTVKIGTVEIFLLAQSGQLQDSNLKTYNVSLLDLDPGQIEQWVASGQLDFGITYAPYPMNKIDVVEIGSYQCGCYCLKGRFKGLSIREIPFAVPAEGLTNNPLGIKERDGWLESITPRYRKYSVNLLSTGLELTRQGLCAIYIPKFVARHFTDLEELEIPHEQRNRQRAYIIRHKDRNRDDLFRILKQTLQKVIQV